MHVMDELTILTLAALVLISYFQAASGNVTFTPHRTYLAWGQTRRCTSTFIQLRHDVHIRKGFNNKLNPNELRRNFPLAIMGKDGGDNDDTQLNLSNHNIQRKSRDEWIGGQEMMQIMAKEEQRKQIQKEQKKSLNKEPPINMVSRISYSDANTLQIELPAAGLNSNAAFSGAFAAVWFGAVAPATLSMLSVGVGTALFMTPFWLAGGLVAKVCLVLYEPLAFSKPSISLWLYTCRLQFMILLFHRNYLLVTTYGHLKGIM